MLKELTERLESTAATVISGIFLVLDLVPHIMGSEPVFHFAWVSVVISGIPLISSAIRKLVFNKGLKRISSALLISIAMVCAIFIGDVFAAGEVAFIMALGEMLEEKTTKRAQKGLEKLIHLTPKTARRITDDGEELVSYTDICKGDILRVLPGETIPADGEIIVGETSVDESVMTGEAMPVDKTVGESVFCGTINRFGAIDICASRVGNDSSFEQLIRMVRDAEESKAPTERIADKWASILVPSALAVAVLAWIITRDIVVGVTILVVFCPCALVLATPTAIMAAIGQATRHGIIIKSGEALERMGKVNMAAFDKTGTLTCGKPTVSDVIPIDTDRETLIQLTASAEMMSEHPLAKAITSYAGNESISLTEPQEFTMSAGNGISATINGHKIICGNKRYINSNGIIINSDTEQKLAELYNEGKTSVITARDTEIIGIIALSDVIKMSAKAVVAELKELGTDTVLLTGDNARAAEYFAEQAGIADCYAELLPGDKVRKLTELQTDGGCVAMLGDGVNDAPALKTADVGIAMGDMGSDIAIDAADITLIGDDISKIPYLKRLSRATLRTIRFGISLSLIINFIGIVLSFMRVLTPVTGALLHNAGSLFVILIAALLYDRRF